MFGTWKMLSYRQAFGCDQVALRKVCAWTNFTHPVIHSPATYPFYAEHFTCCTLLYNVMPCQCNANFGVKIGMNGMNKMYIS